MKVMSEVDKEVLDDVKAALSGEAPPTDLVEDPPPEYTETQQEAMDKGWNPEGVEGKRSLSAEEFLDRQPFYDEIHKLKRLVNKQAGTVDALHKNNLETIKRLNITKEKELKAAKKKAYDEGDLDQLQVLDEQIEEHRTDAAVSEAAAAESDDTPASSQAVVDFEQWVQTNPWYTDDLELKGRANAIAQNIANSGTEMTNMTLYKEVEKRIKAEYPNKFSNQRRAAPSAVEGDTSRGKSPAGSKAKFTARNLHEEDRRLMKQIIDSDPKREMTEAKYIQQMIEVGYDFI
jgi:hypothetical protein